MTFYNVYLLKGKILDMTSPSLEFNWSGDRSKNFDEAVCFAIRTKRYSNAEKVAIESCRVSDKQWHYEYISFKEAIKRGYKVSGRLLRALFRQITKQSVWHNFIEFTRDDLETMYKLARYNNFDKFVHDMVMVCREGKHKGHIGCFTLFANILGEKVNHVQIICWWKRSKSMSLDVITVEEYNQNIEYYKDEFFRLNTFGVNPINHCEEIKTYLDLQKINL